MTDIGGYPVHPAAELFPMLSGLEFDDLVEGIRSGGLITPIVLHEGQILDGRNRLLACQKAGVEPKFVDWKPAEGEDNPWDYVWNANARRRHLPQGQLACLLLRYVDNSEAWQAETDTIRKRANKIHSRIAKAQARADGRFTVGVSNETSTVKPKKDKLAKIGKTGNVARCTVARAAALKKVDPQRYDAVCDGDVSLEEALRTAKREKAVAAVQALPAPTTLKGPWGVIVADPPWNYEKRADDGTHRAALPYPSMSLDEIRDLEIPKPADDAILWLWTTNAHMEHAYGIARRWGFEPKTILTWVKDRMGTGDWLRGQSEHCLLCVRGKPTVALTNQTTVLNGPMRAHSQKPDEFFALVEALCPDRRRIELFAREAREGWEAWGDTNG